MLDVLSLHLLRLPLTATTAADGRSFYEAAARQACAGAVPDAADWAVERGRPVRVAVAACVEGGQAFEHKQVR